MFGLGTQEILIILVIALVIFGAGKLPQIGEGMGKAIKNMDIDDDAFKHIEAIIYSMTAEERENPAIINGGRRKRIANGSGTDIQEVNRLLKQFDETRKMMRMVSQGKNVQRMMAGMQQRGRR